MRGSSTRGADAKEPAGPGEGVTWALLVESCHRFWGPSRARSLEASREA